jgi:regulator of sigma E protease
MLLTIVVFFIVLSILVFVHELGHFWVAKKCGLTPEEFGFGYPPRAIGWQKLKGEKLEKVSETENVEVRIADTELSPGTELIEKTVIDAKKEVDRLVPFTKWRTIKGNAIPEPVEGMQADTIYSINWVPIGGFVKLGEDDVVDADANHFNNRPIWQRALILFAGVFMNYVLAAVIFSIGFMIGMPQATNELDSSAQISNQQIQIVEVIKNSPAEQAGLVTGDVIVSINQLPMTSLDAMEKFVDGHRGKELAYEIKRNNKELAIDITPEVRQETNKGGIGVAIVATGLVRYPFFIAIWEGIKTSGHLMWAILLAFYELLKGWLTGAGVSADLAGPIGIAALTGQATRMGFIYLMQFTALLSINLAIINALPIPALDGGRLLFLLIEKIKGSPVKKEVEGTIHYVGFVLLMALVVFVTFHDVAKYTGSLKLMFGNLLHLFH